MTRGSDNSKGLVDTFRRGYPYTHTHTLVHVQPTEAAAIIVKSSEQPHTGPYLQWLLIHSVLDSIRRKDCIIVIVVVLFTLSLLCRGVVDSQTVLHVPMQKVLCDCPKIPFVISVTTKHRQRDHMRQSHGHHNDDDGGRVTLDDNTDNTLETRSFMNPRGVVVCPTPWNSSTDTLTEIEQREMKTEQNCLGSTPQPESVMTLLFRLSYFHYILYISHRAA